MVASVADDKEFVASCKREAVVVRFVLLECSSHAAASKRCASGGATAAQRITPVQADISQLVHSIFPYVFFLHVRFSQLFAPGNT